MKYSFFVTFNMSHPCWNIILIDGLNMGRLLLFFFSDILGRMMGRVGWEMAGQDEEEAAEWSI